MSDEVATQRSAAPPTPGTREPERYVLREQLGEGAMGVVWSARDTALDRDVALKLLHDRFLGDADQEQLAREARVMARLSHPNVVAVYDVGTQGGRTFLAMELVTGVPLSRWLETPRPWQQIVDVFRGIAEGLAAAHVAGILHRDIKPTNILIGDDGRPRLADFGVAHARPTGALDPGTPLTATTAGLIGSPAYMALERLCGEPADERGDQFSFCVALYEALHGERPFVAETLGGLIAVIARGVPPPIRDIPPWLHAVVARGLAARPADRFASMTELGAALRAPQPRRRHIATFGAIALGILGAIVIAAIAWPRDRAPSPAPGAVSSTPDTPRDSEPVVEPPRDSGALATATPANAVGDPPRDSTELATATSPPTQAGSDANGSARPKPTTPAAPPPDRATATPPPAPLDRATATARVLELVGQAKAAWKAGDITSARKFAEQAIGYDPAHPDPRTIAATSSCRLGDDKRAREHLGKLPRSQSSSRIAVVKVCRRYGIELDELLTPDEARVAH